MVSAKNKCNTLQEPFEIHTPNKEYKNFVNDQIEKKSLVHTDQTKGQIQSSMGFSCSSENVTYLIFNRLCKFMYFKKQDETVSYQKQKRV